LANRPGLPPLPLLLKAEGSTLWSPNAVRSPCKSE
jgi:hypothetical protein